MFVVNFLLDVASFPPTYMNSHDWIFEADNSINI